MALVLRKAVLPRNVSLLKCMKGRPLATAANRKNATAVLPGAAPPLFGHLLDEGRTALLCGGDYRGSLRGYAEKKSDTEDGCPCCGAKPKDPCPPSGPPCPCGPCGPCCPCPCGPCGPCGPCCPPCGPCGPCGPCCPCPCGPCGPCGPCRCPCPCGPCGPCGPCPCPCPCPCGPCGPCCPCPGPKPCPPRKAEAPPPSTQCCMPCPPCPPCCPPCPCPQGGMPMPAPPKKKEDASKDKMSTRMKGKRPC